MASLAELLAYKQKQDEMLNGVSAVPFLSQDFRTPEQRKTDELVLMSGGYSTEPAGVAKLKDIASGAKQGFADQWEGMKQLATDPAGTFVDMYSGLKYAVQNPREAAQAAVEGFKEASKTPYLRSRFVAQNINPLELANALKKVGTMREIVVHHGTPHRFEPTEANPLGEFDASKIGTGRGRQIKGYGIYLTENPKAAEAWKEGLSVNKYRKNEELIDANQIWENAFASALKASKINPDKVANIVAEIRDWVDMGEDINDFLPEASISAELLPAYKAAIREYQGSARNLGSVYKADLPDEMVDRMLDWNKPFKEQSKSVQKSLTDYAELSNIKIDPNMQGNEIYALFGKNATKGKDLGINKFSDLQKAASNQLNWAGIPGIRYLDSNEIKNFVVFPGEEKKVKILERK